MPITLDLRDGVALVSLALAVDGYRRFYNERQARRRARREVLKLVAAESFTNLSKAASDLELLITLGKWEQVRVRANRVKLDLAEADGSWSELLLPSEKDKVEAAELEVRTIQATLPAGDQQDQDPQAGQIGELLNQTSTVYTLLAQVAGKLRYMEEPDPGIWSRIFAWRKNGTQRRGEK
ncbi:MAG: hypothetical protein IH789_13325 [Acidobacteria bacterium]|nr:hypothetical protein [Acidobacteriota bacterium]